MTKRTVKSKKTPSEGELLGNKLLKSVLEMKERKIARTTQITPNEVAAARLKTGLSQTDFAHALHISFRTLQEWEQGRRKPSGAAQALIRIVFTYPQVISATSVK